MYNIEYSSQFKKDFKKNKKPTPDVFEVGHGISTLQRGEKLKRSVVARLFVVSTYLYRLAH